MNYQQMEKDEQNICIDMAIRAFEDYEYFSMYYPRKNRRLRFLRSMLTTEFRINEGREFFLTAKESNQIVAVAILCEPGFQKLSDKDYLKAGFWKAVVYGGYHNVGAWNEMELQAIKPCQDLQNAWYLSMLIVSPDRKSQGIGSRMIQEYLIPFVREHKGNQLCLFTNSETNRRFYQKNGFTEFDEQQFSYNGKTIGSWSYQMPITSEKT